MNGMTNAQLDAILEVIARLTESGTKITRIPRESSYKNGQKVLGFFTKNGGE